MGFKFGGDVIFFWTSLFLCIIMWLCLSRPFRLAGKLSLVSMENQTDHERDVIFQHEEMKLNAMLLML